MRRLKSSIEPSGSIVVFNAPFEKSRMKECAELLPEYKSWVSAVNGRIVDLLNPFKAFNFYHPDQCGSASMKLVLPALTGKDYSKLEIQEGVLRVGNSFGSRSVMLASQNGNESERRWNCIAVWILRG